MSEQQGLGQRRLCPRQRTGSSQVSFMQLDLANLESIHRFCQHFLRSGSRLDLLVNNAGSADSLDGPAARPASGPGPAP